MNNKHSRSNKIIEMVNKELKYHRLIFFTRTELRGAYNYKDIFQIYPIKGEGYPYSKIQKHFPNYIELITFPEDSLNIETTFPEMDELIRWLAPPINKQDLILSLLTTCSNHLFFKYDYPNETWALPIKSFGPDDYDNAESVWCYPVYGSKKIFKDNVIIKYSDITKFERIKKISYKEYFRKNIDEDHEGSGPVKFVDTIDIFLQSYFNLEKELKPIVYNAMYHLKNGVELAKSKKSLSLLSLFTSLETMVDLENRDFKSENCNACGQQKFKVSQKFKNYLTKYVSTHPDDKSKFNKLYSLRSKIIHSGEILKSEFLYSEVSQETKKQENLKIIEVIQFCRVSIVNWVILHSIKKIEFGTSKSSKNINLGTKIKRILTASIKIIFKRIFREIKYYPSIK